MSFSDNIKKWVSIDDEIKELNNIIKNKREQRNNLLTNILEFKNKNNLDGKMIKYNSENLRFMKTRQYQAISYDFIKKCLTEIIGDADQVDYIVNYMKEKRIYKNVEDIKRLCV